MAEILLKEGYFYKSGDNKFKKTLQFKLKYDFVYYGIDSDGRYYCTVNYELFMVVPPKIALGSWRDFNGSYVSFNTENERFFDYFNAGLPYCDNLKGSTDKKQVVRTGSVNIYADDNGKFSYVSFSWSWGVRAWRKQDKTPYYTDGFWEPSGNLLQLPIQPTTPHPLSKPVLNEINTEITPIIDESAYGKYKLLIDIALTSGRITRCVASIYGNNIELERSGEYYITPSIAFENGEDVDVTLKPYNGTIEGNSIFKTINISWPSLYIKINDEWKKGRTWVKDKETWKLCNENYIKVNGEWKTAKHI